MTLALLVLLASSAHAESMVVTAKPVPLHATRLDDHRLDRLTYLGCVELTSHDSRFGGLSGMVAAPNAPDTFWFVSDCGYFVSLRLVHKAGYLVDVDHAELPVLTTH